MDQAAPVEIPVEDIPDWAREALRFDSVEAWFHDVVGHNFWGSLKPPFNVEARKLAGFEEAWCVGMAAWHSSLAPTLIPALGGGINS